MQRNLPHIASLAFNQPLLIEPAYARVFFCALGQEIGAGRLVDVQGAVIESAQMPEITAAFAGGQVAQMDRPYQVQQGIAVLPVTGTLVSRAGSLRPYSGMTGYNGLIARIEMALADSGVSGILLDMDTPGGMVAGGFDAADMIARYRSEKPIWAVANDMHCSAGQLIASACSRRLITQTGRSGSVGVLVAHNSYAGALESEGVEITLIYSGSHKVDGNPYEKLKKSVRDEIQARIDATRQQFAEKVAAYSGMTIDEVLSTEARVCVGQESIDVGFSDEIVINADAVATMADAVKMKIYTGVNMSQNTVTTAEVNQPIVEQGGITKEAMQIEIDKAVAAENARITGILGCEEARGREATASALAGTPGMTLENAQRILVSSPLSAQVRTETELDNLMAGSPAAITSGVATTLAEDDLDNIPV